MYFILEVVVIDRFHCILGKQNIKMSFRGILFITTAIRDPFINLD